ncbi:putative transposase [Bacillus capparidis]|uniref:Transposase n=1 Tax=Bacillus capparidis TaxID=1840411 RepID=A0ABS4D0A2_9BACI|nr:putative transposase [Bacillus capparidis]
MIRNNRHKYSVSAMCAVLQLPRSTYYYESKIRENNEEELTNMVIDIFKNSRNIYGQRKIKKSLKSLGVKSHDVVLDES